MSTIVDVATIAALIGGPVLAVVVSTRTERNRTERNDKLGILRALLVGRLNYTDPIFQTAINTVPIVFWNDKSVMTKWDRYFDAVSQLQPSDPLQLQMHVRTLDDANDELCNQIAISLRFEERHRSKMIKSKYVASSYARQQVLLAETLQAIKDMSAATQRMATANENLTKRLGPVADPAAAAAAAAG